MWNLYPSSKIIDDRIRRKSYERHMQQLKNMKPRMKIVAPSQPEFVYANHKQEMTRRDRLLQIDHQNELLVTKIDRIQCAEYTTNKLRSEAQQLKTLNQHVMNVQQEGIYQQNQRICQKLLKINSHYPTFTIIDKAEQLEKVKSNISENARRAHSVINLHRPQSSITYKFYRSRVAKFDNQGNNTQQKVFKLYQMPSEGNLRPETAPSFKRKNKPMRPYSSEHSGRRPGKALGGYRQAPQNDADPNAEQSGEYPRALAQY